jgi:hypothetical protein
MAKFQDMIDHYEAKERKLVRDMEESGTETTQEAGFLNHIRRILQILHYNT